MKKLSLALVVALAAFSGVAGATVASGAPVTPGTPGPSVTILSPCCKVI
ncbi:hypothetical protein [Cellulomonas sp. HD19AZ1]|nr:hypothetical protein [Cellulomonas sp. HD19AZ1]